MCVKQNKTKHNIEKKQYTKNTPNVDNQSKTKTRTETSNHYSSMGLYTQFAFV